MGGLPADLHTSPTALRAIVVTAAIESCFIREDILSK
jgi:hypothetical protein